MSEEINVPKRDGLTIEKFQDRDVVHDKYQQPLTCYGCAHSAAHWNNNQETLYPGMPSGERPCCFCIRNVRYEEIQKDMHERYGSFFNKWYDQSPLIEFPMDAYNSLDMHLQINQWLDDKTIQKENEDLIKENNDLLVLLKEFGENIFKAPYTLIDKINEKLEKNGLGRIPYP